jgi:RNA polymerase sigma-70 factor, ECF subfamily
MSSVPPLAIEQPRRWMPARRHGAAESRAGPARSAGSRSHDPRGSAVSYAFVADASFAELRSVEDRELIALVGQSDRAAFRELYERHAPSLLAALRRLSPGSDCEDLLQEVFLAVWRRSALYRPERGEPLTWLFAILRNKVIDHRRRLSARPRYEELDVERTQPAAPAADPGDRRLVLEQALVALRPDERRALEMTYFAGLTYEEAAATLEVPLGTLKSRISAGLRRLRDNLGGAP